LLFFPLSRFIFTGDRGIVFILSSCDHRPGKRERERERETERESKREGEIR
jgi:hypothetical protein